MQITDVQAFCLGAELQKPLASGRHTVTRRSAVLARVTTDEGIVGWGEAGSAASQAVPALIRQFAPLVIGRDPFDVDVIWESLYTRVRGDGRQGVAIDAISCIDIALWDIMGKAVGKPIHKILGGCANARIMPYVTGVHYADLSDPLRDRVAQAEAFAELGFRAIKIKIGGLEPEQDLAIVKAIREAVGPQMGLMADANFAYNPFTAISVGRRLEELGILWFEEPVVPEDIDGYLAVKSALAIAIAGGEGESTRYGFKNLISRRAVDIVQPDLGRAGGFSEGKRIAALASAFNVRCLCHLTGTGVAQAAALHFLATLPACPPARSPQPFWHLPVLELDRRPNPFRERVAPDFRPEPDGCVTVPTEPGLGIEVDEDAVRHFTQ